jgi:RHS repeat-associated protein
MVKTGGDAWKYEDYGNGRLSKVIKPGGDEITYKYDPLGRRIEKKAPGATKKFVWDGNTPLHEWEDENLVTWVFNDSFVPAAKLTNSGSYSIISDYLGTPAEAYDADGGKVWSAELDIYGRVKASTGDVDFIPFRYQGQYADPEAGLYYNRFRYYDPAVGQYTQPDPIGLAGNNPTLYGYVGDTNAWIDPWGLWIFYELLLNGKIVYHGITDRAIQMRLIEHARGYGGFSPKVFDQVRHLDVGVGQTGRVAARNLEGSALTHASNANEPLLNATRKASGGYYHQYDPDNLTPGRTFLDQTDIDNKMNTSTTNEVDSRGNIICPV